MRKYAIIVVITFVSVLVFSSCNKETCPAYSSVEVEHAEYAG